MDFLDRASLSPADGTLVQSQAVLFAAALFIGCTLFDVQSANVQVGKLLPFSAAGNATATAAKASPAPAVAALAEPQRLPKAAVPYRVALQRSAQACYRASTGTTPEPLHAWRKTQPAPMPAAASVLALVD